MKTPTRTLATAFCSSLLIILAQLYAVGPKEPDTDEFIYLTIASDLMRSDVFTDGTFAEKSKGEVDRPGRFFAPAYPAFLALMAKADPSVGAFISCHANGRGKGQYHCSPAPRSLLFMQAVLAAVSMTCIFAIALTLSDSLPVASLSLALALTFGDASYYARTYMTENIAFVGFYVFLAAGVAALAHQRLQMFALAGAALSFATLARPGYLYLFYALVAGFLLHAFTGRRGSNFDWRRGAAFVAAGLLVLSPWMIRNWFQFGDPGLTRGYGGFILVQRVAYNSMSWAEWGVSFIYWLPDFGDGLAKRLFSPDLYDRLGWQSPQAFYNVGNGTLMEESLAASGGRAGHLDYLIRTHIKDDLFKHMMVTLPLSLRGLWVGRYLALAGVALIVPVGVALARKKLFWPYMLLVFGPIFMVGFHGFVSVNVERYNIPIIALYSFVVAFTFVKLARRVSLSRLDISAANGN